MSMETMRPDTDFIKHIETAVKIAVNEEVEKQVEAARAAVAKKVHAQVDEIALKVLAKYDLSMNQNKLVITVSKGDLK